ncbi:MAG: L-aspartate oxidase [Nitrospirae bacterium]|nr:L-aspartate oxidase [Nitrospirota bacterium]
MKTDFLIIGCGIAGLRAAIELSSHGKVLIVTKDKAFESSSSYAQGGIAVVVADDDSTQHHVEDTLNAGAGLCKKKAVSVLVRDGQFQVQKLIDWGVRFDKHGSDYLVGLEGAHSRRRILHFKDSTGSEIVRILRKKALEDRNIKKLHKQFAVDLIIQGGVCTGATMLDEDSGRVYRISARATIITTGGAGQLYLRTTNPSGATGDGIALANRAGAVLSDMEFVQFHPTTFALPGAPSFLITEALRGEGAVLRDLNKKRFMHKYHPLAELAPRDELSRAIIRETSKKKEDYVFLDATHMNPLLLRERFPATYNSCIQYNIDLTRDMIPVSPAAHFMIGGIETDTSGRTSIDGLFSAGEVACTGVHGANRLASNSLLEGLVFGARTGIAAAEYAGSTDVSYINSHKSGINNIAVSRKNNHSHPGPAAVNQIRERLQMVMWKDAGIIRTGSSLEDARINLEGFSGELSNHGITRRELELVNMMYTSSLIVSSAIKRRESVGAHYREDYPEWSGKKRHIRIR